MRDDPPIYLDVFDPPATNSMHYRIQLGKDLVLRNNSGPWNDRSQWLHKHLPPKKAQCHSLNLHRPKYFEESALWISSCVADKLVLPLCQPFVAAHPDQCRDWRLFWPSAAHGNPNHKFSCLQKITFPIEWMTHLIMPKMQHFWKTLQQLPSAV